LLTAERPPVVFKDGKSGFIINPIPRDKLSGLNNTVCTKFLRNQKAACMKKGFSQKILPCLAFLFGIFYLPAVAFAFDDHLASKHFNSHSRHNTDLCSPPNFINDIVVRGMVRDTEGNPLPELR
jgi:hypothetical protein